MICKACAEAAALQQRGEEAHKEAGCPALNGRGITHCDCMHRPGDPKQWIQPGTLITPITGDMVN